MDAVKRFFQNVELALGKFRDLITSNRVQFFGAVVALLTFTGYLGLPGDIQAQVADSLARTTDATVELTIAFTAFAKEIGTLLGVLVLAYTTLASLVKRPAVVTDHVDLPKG
jgi:hypothetical protein